MWGLGLEAKTPRPGRAVGRAGAKGYRAGLRRAGSSNPEHVRDPLLELLPLPTVEVNVPPGVVHGGDDQAREIASNELNHERITPEWATSRKSGRMVRVVYSVVVSNRRRQNTTSLPARVNRTERENPTVIPVVLLGFSALTRFHRRSCNPGKSEDGISATG